MTLRTRLDGTKMLRRFKCDGSVCRLSATRLDVTRRNWSTTTTVYDQRNESEMTNSQSFVRCHFSSFRVRLRLRPSACASVLHRMRYLCRCQSLSWIVSVTAGVTRQRCVPCFFCLFEVFADCPVFPQNANGDWITVWNTRKNLYAHQFYVLVLLRCSFFISVISYGHFQLLDHGCGTAFRPTYVGLTLPINSSAGR